MKAVLDVHYSGDQAHAACLVFETWADGEALDTVRTSVSGVRRYRSGRFFERELEPLLAVLEQAGTKFSHILIDGYVHLKDDRNGLGAHLHDALPYPAVVVGVAKSPLVAAARFAPILRGRSTKPLFVSVVGWELEDAVAAIAGMHGPYRIPTLLRMADHIARGTEESTV